MKLYSLLNENHVLIDVDARTLEEGYRMLIEAFRDSLEAERHDELVAALNEREESYPTLIDDDVCVPHMRLEWLDRFLLGLMVTKRPIPHPGAEESGIRLVFMILAPQNKNAMMLQTLAAIVRLLKSKETKQALLSVRAPGRLIRIVEESGVDVRKTLVAADVMSPVSHTVTLDTILARAVDVIVDAPDEGIPILDENERLVGELTSKELLSLGMPRYLSLLRNPAMLESFEPFENFFQHENSMRARELCRRDILTVTSTAPVVQVAHMMMTNHKRRVYVVDDSELKGVIYRKNLVTRVLHI